MSLCFKAFAKFLMCALFTLNQQVTGRQQQQRLGGTVSTLWCYCSVNTSSQISSSPRPITMKKCPQFWTPPARSRPWFDGPAGEAECLLPVLSSQPDLAVPGRSPCILAGASKYISVVPPAAM